MKLDRRSVMTGLMAFPMSANLTAGASPPDPILRTTSGDYRGARHNGLQSFLGVRYGEDTSRTRFAKPMPAQRREGVQDALTYGASAPQHSSALPHSEDCLFLNLWTPGLADHAKRPIMVYLHGGAYNWGSGSDALYDGSSLATKGDVVVITLNHRLNAFGYLYLDRLFQRQFPDSGNAGQWDILLALHWIHDNAAAFGGDASRVMLFGQSGGGAKIATLMATPAASGLFHAAATMSGQQVTACGPLNGTARASRFLEATGLRSAEDLLAAPVERLLDGLTARDPVNDAHSLYFGPVLDERMLTRHPFWPDAPAQSADIPMILGNTIDETKAFLWNDEAFALTWDSLPAYLAKQLRCDIHPGVVISAYRDWFPELSPTEIMFKATTAGRSWRGQVEEADARARQGGPTWVYQFNLPAAERARGAGHTIDIAHAFDNLHQPGATSGTGPSAMRVADQLSTAFIRLAHTGDPNHAGLPRWDRHTLPDRRTMILDAATRQENDPRQRERELFAKIPFIQWGT